MQITLSHNDNTAKYKKKTKHKLTTIIKKLQNLDIYPSSKTIITHKLYKKDSKNHK